MQESETLASAGQAELTLTNPRQPGSVYVFVPAHGESGVGSVQHPLHRAWTEDLDLAVLLADFSTREQSVWVPEASVRRLDGRTWGAFVREENGAEIFDARLVDPTRLARLIEHAREEYDLVSVDLTGARESQAIEVLRAATSIFLVSTSDLASLEMAAEKVAWIKSFGLDDRCALLLKRVQGGLRPDVAEDVAGVPVCSLVDEESELRQLACWLGSNGE